MPVARLAFRLLLPVAALATALALGGCSTVYVPNFIKVYQPDIAQGNIIEPAQIAQLHEGMSSAEVQAIMGTPALQDIFHRHRRETYVFYDKRGKNKAFEHVLTVEYDDNGRVSKIEQRGEPLDQAPSSALLPSQRSAPKAADSPPEQDSTGTPAATYSLTPAGGNAPALGTPNALQPQP
ncbi:outer membrane protein assembly factor BamE [Halothiobacillus sp. DCM-1]|uniref:outer membrane protein assembly factor BamE n=1 Tax=Halothiobacillus sp. DCM-1 TaxID=3112558 RepID=UPI0032432DB0